MHNVCNIRMPQAICDIISSIGIGAAAVDSIGYRASARYRSNPNLNGSWNVISHRAFCASYRVQTNNHFIISYPSGLIV